MEKHIAALLQQYHFSRREGRFAALIARGETPENAVRKAGFNGKDHARLVARLSQRSGMADVIAAFQGTPPAEHTSGTSTPDTSSLLAFYRHLMDDPELRPADRIAAARRLEALLGGPANDDSPPTPPTVIVELKL